MIYEGQLTDQNQGKFAIVVSRFNSAITERLLSGALASMKMVGVPKEQVDVCWVPGALEIPLMTQKLARSQKYTGIVTLGAVIKGDTDHYDLVINGVAQGVARVSLDEACPIVFGILTTDTLEQAQQRAGGKAGNKGGEVALSLLELCSLYQKI
ncbi:6,7-dimethyl-8-ribityllumazine synthase [Eupransor demetentiae]|uniref:6,7-dimethyl-8-ribityllumazine synthase n=1 Tax=Eupransor demetentiae TaxID=3109584 RepID=A0ABM9N4C0_9LACO|nr:6 [Lactobacillaceae bacterium LMG 33000] [Lactobacillaceae bacterium LMG 33000]